MRKVSRLDWKDTIRLSDSLFADNAPDIFATSFWRRAGLTALRAPAAALDTALNISAGQVKKNDRNGS